MSKMLTVEQVAGLMQVDPQTVNVWLKGQLPFMQVGRVRRVAESDLLAFVQRNRRGTNAAPVAA
jgi:excisionase family DNA binding protein